jgi:hypothetical protein
MAFGRIVTARKPATTLSRSEDSRTYWLTKVYNDRTLVNAQSKCHLAK